MGGSVIGIGGGKNAIERDGLWLGCCGWVHLGRRMKMRVCGMVVGVVADVEGWGTV